MPQPKVKIKFECPECKTVVEEEYFPREAKNPRLKICWFCHDVKGKATIMEEITRRPSNED